MTEFFSMMYVGGVFYLVSAATTFWTRVFAFAWPLALGAWIAHVMPRETQK